jgi:monoterpene epsilon-lactone hydrolase
MASAELEAIVGMLRANQPSEEPSVEEMRASIEMLASVFTLPPDVRTEPVSVGSVPAEWVAAPGAADTRVVLYLHGGGYVMGSINTHRELASRVSRAAAARVLLIDYRLAPEHPHPAAVEDAVAAYRWLLERGVAPAHLAIAGDSAGGGLTVATLVALREARVPLPAAAACLSPWVDLEGLGESMATRAAVDPMVQREPLRRLASLYLGGQDPRTPLAAPLHADLRGLPPLLIQVGDAETLFDDAMRLADRARAAGVEVTLEPWPEMIHVWQLFANMLPEGQQAIDNIGAFLRQRLG